MKTYKQFCTEANTALTENAATAGTLTKPRTGNALTRLRTSVGQALSPVTRPVTQLRDRIGQAISPVTRPVNRVMNRVQPFRNFYRAQNVGVALDKNQSPVDRIGGAVGVALPMAGPIGAAIVNQGQSGSAVDTLAQNIPGMKADPKTDVGKKLGDKIGQGVNYLGNQVKRYSDWARKNNVRSGY
tara:strand:+ start:667 stop:1221 length:555 start_codon:yes stop_codon:yes gene_type:complete